MPLKLLRKPNCFYCGLDLAVFVNNRYRTAVRAGTVIALDVAPGDALVVAISLLAGAEARDDMRLWPLRTDPYYVTDESIALEARVTPWLETVMCLMSVPAFTPMLRTLRLQLQPLVVNTPTTKQVSSAG